MNDKKVIKMNDNTKVIKTIYVGMTPNGEVRYTYKSKDGMKYTTPEPILSKKNKLCCPWIKVYDPNTKQSVMINSINYKDPRFYRASAFFIKHIPLLKEQDQYILEPGLYIIEY